MPMVVDQSFRIESMGRFATNPAVVGEDKLPVVFLFYDPIGHLSFL